jgi:hypothetical protein
MIRSSCSLPRLVRTLTDTGPDPVSAKLQELSQLRPGWHFGEGVPSSRRSVATAMRIWGECREFGVDGDAFPTLDGSVVLVLYGSERCVEVSINSTDETIQLVTQVGRGFDYEEYRRVERARESDVLEAVSALVGEERKWVSLESSTRSSMTEEYSVSAVPVSPIQATEPEFRWSTSTALDSSKLPVVYAAI